MLIYTEQAAQSVAVCVLADIVAGAVDCGQQGLDEAFFFLSQDGFIYYTHTHTLNRAESVYCGAYTSQRGAFWGRRGGLVKIRAHSES